MSNALHSTENVARMRACSALVHSTRARAAPPLSPRPRHTSAAMHGCAQTAACRALAANGVASPLLSACSSISAHAICRAKRAHVYACHPSLMCMHICVCSHVLVLVHVQKCAPHASLIVRTTEHLRGRAGVWYLRVFVPRARPVQHERHRPPVV